MDAVVCCSEANGTRTERVRKENLYIVHCTFKPGRSKQGEDIDTLIGEAQLTQKPRGAPVYIVYTELSHMATPSCKGSWEFRERDCACWRSLTSHLTNHLGGLSHSELLLDSYSRQQLLCPHKALWVNTSPRCLLL